MTLGEVLDEMVQIREQRRDLDAQDKKLKLEYDELEEKALAMMHKQGLDRASGNMATGSVSETEIPSVVDWTKALRWIKREHAFQLFERRIAKGAWVEALEMRKGRPIPGIETIVKTRLNLRTR
jgi:hypothetical protein